MKTHRLVFTAIIVFTFTTMIACAFSSTATPTGSSNSPATLVSSTIESSTATPAAVSPTATSIASSSGGCTNAYFPVSTVATWSYSSSGGYKGDYTYIRTMADVSDTGFTTSDQYSTGVKWTAKWNCQNGNLAALDAGPESLILATSDYTITSSSVTATGYSIPATFNNGNTWSEEITIIGSVVNSAGKTINGQIVVNLDCTAAGTDTITVPAGKFDTVTATCSKKVDVSSTNNGKTTQLGTNQEEITDWYAKSVGFVKSVATGGSNNETIVLTKYKQP